MTFNELLNIDILKDVLEKETEKSEHKLESQK